MILFLQKQLRSLFPSLILLLFSLLSFSSCSKEEKAVEERTAIILFTNDSHGRVTPDANNSMIGLDYIASIKKERPGALLVDVGDTFHGLPIALENEGENIAIAYNEIPYDLMVPGNHDFNYGPQRLLALSKLIKFPLICANVFNKESGENPFPSKGIILTSGGIKIGFIGIATKEITLTASAKDIAVSDYSASALQTAQELKEQGAEVLVLLAHISRKESKELAALCKDRIDLIIDAHDHTTEFDKVGDIQIFQAGAHGKYIGEAKIELAPDGKVQNISARLINEEDAHTLYTPLASITTMLNGLTETLMEKLSEVIGTSQVTLSAYRGDAQNPGIRNSEQPLGNLFADAIRIYTNTNIALINGGDIRADIPPDNITKYNLLSTSPFYSYVVVKKLSAHQLRQAFEISLASYPNAFGGFLQISGCTLEFDSREPAGSRVKRIVIDTDEVNLNNTVSMYNVSMNDYIASGGDGYEIFATIPATSTGDAVNTIYEKHITAISPLTASNTGVYERIVDVALLNN